MNKPWMMTYQYQNKEWNGGWFDSFEEANEAAILSTLNGNPGVAKENLNYKS